MVLIYPVKRRVIFVTGTDTGVGKTVFSAALCRQWRASGVAVAALKPLSSGNRDDAIALQRAQDHALTLDEINPWHFRAALAPLAAARRERRMVRLSQVVRRVRDVQQRFPIVIVEGAGGLLSPLGEDFDSRDLIQSLQAAAIVVCPNRLGAVNQVRLVLAALSAASARRAQIVLISPARSTSVQRENLKLLAEFLHPERIHPFPWIKPETAKATLKPRALEAMDRLIDQLHDS